MTELAKPPMYNEEHNHSADLRAVSMPSLAEGENGDQWLSKASSTPAVPNGSSKDSTPRRKRPLSAPIMNVITRRTSITSMHGMISKGRTSSADSRRKSMVRESLVIANDTKRARLSIQAGSLDTLLDLLTSPEADEFTNYVDTFVTTHNYFVDSTNFMQGLIERFYESYDSVCDVSSPKEEGSTPVLSRDCKNASCACKEVCKRVIHVFKKWIDAHGEEFTEEDFILFNMFLCNLEKSEDNATHCQWGAELRALLAEKHSEIGVKPLKSDPAEPAAAASPSAQVPHLAVTEPAALGASPETSPRDSLVLFAPAGKPRYAAMGEMEAINWKKTPPAEVAVQMALLERKLLRGVVAKEFLHMSWSKEGGAAAPRLVRVIERFNRVSWWVASSVLAAGVSPKKRAKRIKIFVKLAYHCMADMANFQGVMQIYTGLNNLAIQKLKEEWKIALASSKVAKMFKAVEELLDPSHNFRNYRKAILDRQPPAIPLLSIHLSDLTMIEENKNTLQGMVHFEKMEMIYDRVSEVRKYITPPYPQRDVPELQQILLDPPCFSPDMLAFWAKNPAEMNEQLKAALKTRKKEAKVKEKTEKKSKKEKKKEESA